MDPLVLESWREAEAVHGVRPARLPSSDADDAAHAETVVALVTPNRGGAGMHMSVAERRDVAIAFLTDRQLRTGAALARKFNRTREAIAACLKGDEFERIRDEVNASAIKLARARLDGAVEEAADSWVNSLEVAARKGDHRPAKDLLLHTKVIDPVNDGWTGPQVIVQIGCKDSDVQITPVIQVTAAAQK